MALWKPRLGGLVAQIEGELFLVRDLAGGGS